MKHPGALRRKFGEDMMSSSLAETDHNQIRRESEIIAQLRKGERSGIEQLMDYYGESLMRYLVSILDSREAAEDAFQDTWIRVMERIHRFTAGKPFAPWLFRIARNRAYDHLRRKKRWWSLGSDTENDYRCEPRDIETFIDGCALRAMVASLRRGFCPAYRELICLRFCDETS